MKYKLTIALITMNRSEQLKRAIESCAESELPEKTQFVVVDNASTDDTQSVMENMKKDFPYDLVYHREEENRGVGGGRNICFDLAEGEYIYFFDDDAEIPDACRDTFFTESIEFMDRNPNVALLTTDVEDKVFGRREIASARSMRVEDFKCVMTFHGGTTFARRSCFSSPMFMNIMYGNEEIAVSSYVYDKSFCIVYIPHLYIEHKPMVNKWNESNIEFLNIQGISNIYMIKKMICPVICRPLLYAAYIMRLKKNSIADRNLINEFRKKRKAFCRNNCMKKIRFNTVVKMFKEFGIKVF